MIHDTFHVQDYNKDFVLLDPSKVSSLLIQPNEHPPRYFPRGSTVSRMCSQRWIQVCCSVLQRVAVCCSMLQCVAVSDRMTCVVVCCSVLQCVAVHSLYTATTCRKHIPFHPPTLESMVNGREDYPENEADIFGTQLPYVYVSVCDECIDVTVQINIALTLHGYIT